MQRQYVDVVILEDTYGHRTPLEIRWADGRAFQLDSCIQLPEETYSRGTTPYSIDVKGKKRMLYHDEDGWFVYTE